MIKFHPSGKIIETGWPDIRNKRIKWGNTALRLNYKYRQGFINTTKGTKVEAFELIDKSLNVELFDRTTGNALPKHPSFFKQFRLDLTYNCFGYCFAESKVFLPNPTQFLIEEYEEVGLEEAELILFKDHNGFGDNGDELINYSHSAKILSNGNVSFKPGINELIEDVNIGLAIHTYNFNHELYYRKKEK